MNKKLIIATVASLVVLTTGIVFAQPKLSNEKKEFYNNKIIEQNNENSRIREETLKVAQMPDCTEKQQKEQDLRERKIKFKNDSTKTMEEMQQDGYVNEKDILDNNSKLIKKLEGLKKITEWDISTYQDQELIDFETKQLNKIKALLEKVKNSDESKFSELQAEYNQMIKSFQEERPIFEEQYKKKHSK